MSGGVPVGVVLGATAGTGAAIARAVARDLGYDIYGVHRGRHPDGATALVNDVRELGRRCDLEVFDAGTFAGSRRGADALLALHGPRSVRFLVHSIANASVRSLVIDPVAEEHHFHKTFDSMAHSFVWWAQALLERDLLAPNACLLALSNPMLEQCLRGTALIAATKGALRVYVRHLAQELGPRGHRVNMLTFGAVPTTALATTMGAGRVAGFAEKVASVVAGGRLASLQEVAGVACFVASDAGAFFNGADLDFTGGETHGLLDHLVFGGRR